MQEFTYQVLLPIVVFGGATALAFGAAERIENGHPTWPDKAIAASWDGIKYVLLAQWCKKLWR